MLFPLHFQDWKRFVKAGGLLMMHDVRLIQAGGDEDSGPGTVVLEQLGDDSGFGHGKLTDTLYSTMRL